MRDGGGSRFTSGGCVERGTGFSTGVDVDLEEEGVIKLSSFDAVRREIARVALERLIKDGRIQPARIEEIVAKTITCSRIAVPYVTVIPQGFFYTSFEVQGHHLCVIYRIE